MTNAVRTGFIILFLEWSERKRWVLLVRIVVPQIISIIQPLYNDPLLLADMFVRH